MIRERDGLDGPERHVKIFRNAAGATILTGYPLFFDITATGDGVRVGQCIAGGSWAFAGVALQDAAVGADLRVQTWGWGLMFVMADISFAIASGEPLVPAVAAWYFTKDPTSLSPTPGAFQIPIIALETVPSSLSAAIQLRKVMIHA